MKAAQLTDNVVTNVIVVDSLDFISGLIDGTGAAIGDTWNGTQFVKPAPPMPTLEDYDAALTAHLDAVAQSRRWADRISLMSRAGFVGPWQQDAIAFGQWADGCNVIGYQLLAGYQAGLVPQPTIAEMLALMPAMVWPE